jgi:SAM-dependent methyltransferase
MNTFLHPKRVVQALYYGFRWRLKKLLRLPEKPRLPVVSGDLAAALIHHRKIATLVSAHLPDMQKREGLTGCEIGSGDCLVIADLLLGKGYKKVYLVEKQRIVVNNRQIELLERLRESGLPNRLEAVIAGTSPSLNAEKVTVIPEFFENAVLTEKVDFIFSHDVIEHVEDLEGFFLKCASILSPDGLMVHKFDLSGHEFFEYPIPHLDFQTYSDWLYDLMFPKYRRSCRWFLDEITDAVRSAGFTGIEAVTLTTEDADYARKLHPRLRTKARRRTLEQILPMDVLLTARLNRADHQSIL